MKKQTKVKQTFRAQIKVVVIIEVPVDGMTLTEAAEESKKFTMDRLLTLSEGVTVYDGSVKVIGAYSTGDWESE